MPTFVSKVSREKLTVKTARDEIACDSLSQIPEMMRYLTLS